MPKSRVHEPDPGDVDKETSNVDSMINTYLFGIIQSIQKEFTADVIRCKNSHAGVFKGHWKSNASGDVILCSKLKRVPQNIFSHKEIIFEYLNVG